MNAGAPDAARRRQAPVEAVIFDLDGVLVSTDELHFLAWRSIAEEVGVPFDRAANERLRGVSRMESLDLLLDRRAAGMTDAEKEVLATRKNERYRAMLERLSPADLLPGARRWLDELRGSGVRIAVGSSSRNAEVILERTGLTGVFDAVADGTRIARSKPDPEVFLLAAADLGVPPARCLVVEDAVAGVVAARASGMRVLAVGSAAGHTDADVSARSLAGLAPDEVLARLAG